MLVLITRVSTAIRSSGCIHDAIFKSTNALNTQCNIIRIIKTVCMKCVGVVILFTTCYKSNSSRLYSFEYITFSIYRAITIASDPMIFSEDFDWIRFLFFQSVQLYFKTSNLHPYSLYFKWRCMEWVKIVLVLKFSLPLSLFVSTVIEDWNPLQSGSVS